jgi:DNA-binding CsgD family transcriptional regulator
MDLMRLSNIANYLTLEKDLEAAVQYVALNACVSGEPCRFYLARLNSDLTLYHLASFGFSEEFISKNREFSLLTNPLLNQAIQTESVLIRNRDDQYRREFANLLETKEDTKWKSTIFMPLLPHYAATLSTQIEVPNEDSYKNYFVMLKALINLYIHLLDSVSHSKRGGSPRSKEQMMGNKLTERQALILDLVKSGMTNNAIANKMGYSESLIRQETMAIYQKLGIDGRKGISRNELFNESPDDESHGIQT